MGSHNVAIPRCAFAGFLALLVAYAPHVSALNLAAGGAGVLNPVTVSVKDPVGSGCDKFLAPCIDDHPKKWAWGRDVYHTSIPPLLVATLALMWHTRPKTGDDKPLPEFWAHRWRYIAVWAPAVAADWLQGPYIYALYLSYGYSSDMIAKLFIADFGASMVFGLFIGALVDTWGRKRCAVLYCAIHAVACLTMHSSNFGWLLLGRVAGGAGTSLLNSTFECWMVSEHRVRQGFSQALLRYMFGVMFFVQYLAAIVAGIVAQWAADAMPLAVLSNRDGSSLHYGGFTTPFDLSLVLLLVTVPLVCFLWEENHGETRGEGQSLAPFIESVSSSFKAVCGNGRVAALGLAIALFEGSMFAFVVNWTPALTSMQTTPPPYGLIFSAFMMACMCGSCIFSLCDHRVPAPWVICPVLLLAAAALAVATRCAGGHQPGAVFAGFLVFEFCVGAYFPAMGALKSEIVEEGYRAGVYNLYRIPLNAVAVGLLLTNISPRIAFSLCCLLISLAAMLVVPLVRPTQKDASAPIGSK